MRTLIAIVLFCLAATEVSNAQTITGSVELLGIVRSEGANTPQIDVYVAGPIKGKIGWSAFTLTTDGFAEAYAGPTFSPTNWLSVSASLGLENNDQPIRQGYTLWAGKGGSFFFSIQEDGGSGRWQKNLLSVRTTSWLSLGVLHQSYVGFGPYVQTQIGKLSLWGSYAPKDHRGIVASKIFF